MLKDLVLQKKEKRLDALTVDALTVDALTVKENLFLHVYGKHSLYSKVYRHINQSLVGAPSVVL